MKKKTLISLFLCLLILVQQSEHAAASINEWIENKIGFGSYVDIHYADGKWVAVADNGYIAVSSNGVEWEEIRLPSIRLLSAVDYANGRWITVGTKLVDDNQVQAAYTSLNGYDWQEISLPDMGVNSIRFEDVHYANGRWVISGGHHTFFTSTDGLNWTEINWSHGLMATAKALHYANGRWVGVGCSGRIGTSTNGTTWTAIETTGTTCYSDVYYGNGKWVAVGSNGMIATSTTGTTWDFQSLTPAAINAVHYADGIWVATGGRGSIFMSTDGTTWTVSEGILEGVGNDVIHTGEGWVVVGSGGGLTGQIATSTSNGRVWRTSNNSPSSLRPSYVLRGIDCFEGECIAIGYNGGVVQMELTILHYFHLKGL